MAKEILQVKVYQLKTAVFLLELLIKSYNILTQYSKIRNLKTGTFKNKDKKRWCSININK